MRLTLLLLTRKPPPNNMRNHNQTKATFRRPMQGRYANRQREPKTWDITMGEIDEEIINELGQTVPMREKIPVIMVPDLKGFELKPYVSHKIAKHHEPALQSKDLFDMFYAPKVQAEFAGTKLEPVPDPKDLPGIASRIRNALKRTQKPKIAENNDPR